MKRMLLIILPLILLFAVGAVSAAQDRPVIVASTTILADVAQNVAGDLLTVTPLIPANVDPHAFEPTTAHAALVAGADALLVVGAGYEAFLADLLTTVGADIPVYVISNGIEILPYGGPHEHEGEEAAADHEDEHEHLGVLGDGFECEPHEHEAEAEDEHEHGACDPHVWHDVANVLTWTENLVASFSAIDPANADAYRANGEAYIAQLDALDVEIRAIVSTIPEDRRVLITNHEFMGYYAHAYGFEVAATVLPAAATGGEIAPQDLAGLIELVRAEGVPAIFAENTTTAQLAELIAQEAGVNVVTALYSDALGTPESGAATYIDLMRFNTQTIADALK
ncbi:MAG: zinc ABC transporter substrate-binding protein [Anaerolinea sp.]|nr:zinc ABC transporter substrate-binding protein [Anaerolinea sp.]